MSYLISLFEQHSYLMLFIGIFLELLALPISGEFLMSYAGYFVYQGKMNYILALLTAFMSASKGTIVTYWITIFVPSIGLILITGLVMAISTSTNVLTSDFVGGYVYGGVWIFFNFLLFEMFRLIFEKHEFYQGKYIHR